MLAMAGLDNLGGVDLDAALLEFVATVHRGQDPDAWQRLEQPETPADRRHRRHLIEDIRAAKEMLSRAPSAAVPVPLLELEARVSREEFDALARPLLERTVSTTLEVIREANLPAGAHRGRAPGRWVQPDPARRGAAARGIRSRTVHNRPAGDGRGGGQRAAGQRRIGHHPRRDRPWQHRRSAASSSGAPVDTLAGELRTPVLPVPAAAAAPSFAPGVAALPSPTLATVPAQTLPVPTAPPSFAPQWMDDRHRRAITPVSWCDRAGEAVGRGRGRRAGTGAARRRPPRCGGSGRIC